MLPAVPLSARLIEPVDVEGEPRIRDLDLAARLGFSDTHKIRQLIKSHLPALERLGVSATVAETAGSKGGRPGVAYYLNRKQAIFITAKSETPAATEITIEIVEQFNAYERGTGNPRDIQAALNDPAWLRQALLAYDEKVIALQATVKEQAATVAAYDRIANSDGLRCLTDAAKVLGQQPKAFIRWLFAEQLIYKRPGSSRWVAYQAKLQSGWFEHKVHVYVKPDGTECSADQVMVTTKGIAKLAKMLGVSVPEDELPLREAAE